MARNPESPFRFLDLPLELRRMIYRKTFLESAIFIESRWKNAGDTSDEEEDDETGSSTSEGNEHENMVILDCFWKHSHSHLRLVCSQINQEARPILAQSTSVTTTTGLLSKLPRIMPTFLRQSTHTMVHHDYYECECDVPSLERVFPNLQTLKLADVVKCCQSDFSKAADMMVIEAEARLWEVLNVRAPWVLDQLPQRISSSYRRVSDISLRLTLLWEDEQNVHLMTSLVDIFEKTFSNKSLQKLSLSEAPRTDSTQGVEELPGFNTALAMSH